MHRDLVGKISHTKNNDWRQKNMLNFDEFTALVTERIGEYLPDVKIEEVKVTKVKKVNQELTGMMIMKEGENTCPNIYLEGFYDSYHRGMSMDSVLREVADMYNESYQKIPNVSIVSDFSDKDYILENVYLTLVNRAQNEDLIDECPHMDIEGMPDIMGIYRVSVNGLNTDDVASYRLDNNALDKTDVSIEELERVAMKNTKRMFPPMMENLCDILARNRPAGQTMDVPENDMLKIISNEKNLYGATAVLYTDELTELAESLGENLILIPSSIHEFLAVPDNERFRAEDFCSMVQDVNMNMLYLSERLSNNIFYFNKDTREYSQLTHVDRRLDDDFSMDKVV
jgi:hypothetical protein